MQYCNCVFVLFQRNLYEKAKKKKCCRLVSALTFNCGLKKKITLSSNFATNLMLEADNLFLRVFIFSLFVIKIFYICKVIRGYC